MSVPVIPGMRELLVANDRECIEACKGLNDYWRLRCLDAYALLFEQKADMLAQSYGLLPKLWRIPT